MKPSGQGNVFAKYSVVGEDEGVSMSVEVLLFGRKVRELAIAQQLAALLRRQSAL